LNRYIIGKWMKVGIVEEGGKEIHPEAGTPQGGIISPILANLYLHYVLDLWFEKRMKRKLQGRARLFRYADDFIVLFEEEQDARNFKMALEERLHSFGLDLAQDKTRIVELRRQKQDGEFDFLGFTFRWGKSYKGYTRSETHPCHGVCAPSKASVSLRGEVGSHRAKFFELLK
jgi:RNA-directed DNA polymerase